MQACKNAKERYNNVAQRRCASVQERYLNVAWRHSASVHERYYPTPPNPTRTKKTKKKIAFTHRPRATAPATINHYNPLYPIVSPRYGPPREPRRPRHCNTNRPSLEGPCLDHCWMTFIYIVDHIMGMDQYLLIPFLVGWTSIYQLFWCSPGVQGFDTLPYVY